MLLFSGSLPQHHLAEGGWSPHLQGREAHQRGQAGQQHVPGRVPRPPGHLQGADGGLPLHRQQQDSTLCEQADHAGCGV